MSGLKRVELGILTEFSRVCEKEGLTWYAMFGTLLGTVRHGGFIPWDDDIDVAMPRADYDRLRTGSNFFSEPYFLQTPQNDPAASPRFMRLRRSDTTVIAEKPNQIGLGGNLGICIDILPLDDVPDAAAARRLHSLARRIQRQMRASAALDENPTDEVSEVRRAFCYASGGIAGCYSLLAERYEKVCAEYSGKRYYAVPAMGGVRGCRIFDKQWFSNCVQMDFESIKLPVPAGWKEILTVTYPEGLDAPEESERESKYAKAIIDTNRPYKEYLPRYTDMLKGIDGKRVYIFGAGDSLRIWLERYSQGLEVVCAFDNSAKKWNTTAYGVTVRSPQELPSLIDADSRLIIASIWHKEISKQLDNMNISEYYVFIDGVKYKSTGESN